MSTDTDFAKLNRLRVNAGKPELKSWKGSKAALDGAIQKLIDAGHVDALPGAQVNIAPVADDPELAKTQEPPSVEDSAMSKNIANPAPVSEVEKKRGAKLARGLDTDPYARQSRLAVQMQREAERREDKAKKDAEPKKKKLTKAEKKAKKAAKKLKLSEGDKQQIKDEAKSRKGGKLPKGQVDPKKDPEKAARQAKHIEDKRAARAGKPAKEKSGDEVTVAELCRELGIDPKVGRAKLRRHEDKLTKLHSEGQDRWTFPKKAAAEIKAILKGGK